MCLIALALSPHPDVPLVVVANRDEAFLRATSTLHRWESGVLAGRDLVAGGTWMGVHPERGRVAMVTNVREPRELAPKREGEASRGDLVRDFLEGDADAASFVAEVRARDVRGFNLIAIDAQGAWWSSNRGGEPTRLVAGVHGVSNALLDTPWPKVVRAKGGLTEALAQGVDEETLFAILADDRPAADATLPDTGVGLELERALSPVRIAMSGYGTRASTVLVVRDGKVRVVERSIAPTPGEVRLEARFATAL
ncbi:MAG: NRDE family protein [Polyangiales bacterium]